MSITFLDLFNASISASWLVLVVIGLRFLLKKAPKAIHCALWALVAIRLLCPVTIESPVSLMPSSETVSREYLMEQSVHSSQQTVLDIVENPIYPEDVNVFIEAPVSRISVWDIEWSVIWFIGVGIMAAYMLISWLRLRHKVATSIPIARDIRLCDHIESPFILGVFRPLIYLPSDMEQSALDHVLAHEKAHLARKDHWWKPLGFLLLTIHWFNPVMWLAYILLCRDIELACDEKVIRDLNAEQKKAYSTALLGCSVSRPLIAACPLAVGEVGVKERVKSVLNYRKPAFWFVVLAVILCVVVAVCFLTDPMRLTVHDIVESGDYTILAQCDEYFDLTMTIGDIHPDAFSADGHTYGEKEIIVYESDTTAIWLRSIKFANEGDHLLDFEFDISYELPKVGTVVLPYRISDDNDYQIHWRLAETPGYEDVTSGNLYRFYLRGTDSDNRFTISADTAYIRNYPGSFIVISVCMNQLTYAKSGMEPELNRGVFSSAVSQDKSFQASGSEVYRVGWDSRQREVFLDPYGAFQQFTQDYAAAIKLIEFSNSLEPLTPLNYYEYFTLGWQTTALDAQLTADCAAVSDFLDIYDNNMIPVDDNEESHNGTYRAGKLLAQHGLLSSGFGYGDKIFHLSDYHLSVYDLMGEEVFASSRIVISQPTREEVFETVHYRVVVWKENGTITQEVKEDFIPDGVNIELWRFYTDGMAEAPEYTLFFFDGELKWFAKNYYHSYEQIWEVTTPVDEEEKLPSGTYVYAEKVYWALHSSLYVYDTVMEVNNNALVLRFNEGAWSEGPFSLEADWQTECPISEERREILAELSDIEPAFALTDLSGCRFLVIDPTHFLVEKDGELYVVAWQHSNIHLEMIAYIFHMVPETNYVTIPLGTANLEKDPVEEAIVSSVLTFHMPKLETNQMAAISYDIYAESAIMQGDEPPVSEMAMNVRLAVYHQEDDGSIQESRCDYIQVNVQYKVNEGDVEIVDCQQEVLPEPPEDAILLEADCWTQAYDHFSPDSEAILDRLRQQYPEYFELSDDSGIALYWKNTTKGIRCVLAPETNASRTEQELKNLPSLTVPEAMLILGTDSTRNVCYQIAEDGSAVPVIIP